MLSLSLGSIFLLLLETVPLWVVMGYCFSYNKNKSPVFLRSFPLLVTINSLINIALFFNLKNILLWNSLVADFSLLWLFIYCYKIYSPRKNREFYVKLLFFSSLVVINQLWDVVLFLQYRFFVYPSIQFINDEFQNISFYSVLHMLPDTNVIDSLVNTFVVAFTKAKTIMLLLWLLVWGTVYCLVTKAHQGKYKFNDNIQFCNKNCNWIVCMLLVGMLSYRSYQLTGLVVLFFGIFSLYLINSIILFLICYLFIVLFKQYLKIEMKNKLSVINLFSLSCLLVCSHFFEWLHVFFKIHGVYYFSSSSTPSFSTALSLTYCSIILFLLWILLFLYEKIKNNKFSINDNISVVVIIGWFFVVVLTHIFVIVPQINKTDLINELIFEKVADLNMTDQTDLEDNMHIAPGSNYRVSSFEQFVSDLKNCKICKINQNQNIDIDLIKSKLEKNQGHLLNLKDCNVKLVYVVFQSNGQVLYNLNLSNRNTFFTVCLYTCFYLINLLFWCLVIFTVEKIHKFNKVFDSV